ncbi:MAG: nitroreductase family deazaflavin-dependent oxidoreductase, partial [Gammaproteobacteria bacterium]|nr:nitroreductase family deazaflavin-dependent oxidoreductase [Gammaproteobacteria bacterium]
LNLQANPSVEYQIDRVRVKAKAEVLEKDHPDYAALWNEHNANNADRYDEYQAKTDRPIPLVRLVPVG